jgi:tetratricopeptide (TPR) repeat protein
MKTFSRLMRTLRRWGHAWQTHFTLPLGRLLGTCRRRVQQWRRRLSFRLFFQGLPALLGIAALLTLSVLGLSVPTAEVEARYAEKGRAAFQAKDYPLALTCFERACAQGGEQPEILFALALAAEALGQTERAALVMSQLAPPDSQGYGEAHLWQALRLLQADPQTPAMRKAAEAHLLRALQGEIKDRELAHVLLGEVYFAAGQLDLAEQHLTKGLKARPVARLRLARLYQLRGDTERARREALIAAEYFKARAQANLQDHFSRLAWADAVTFAEQFPEAVAILEEGWTVSQKIEYRVALGRVYASWCDYQVRVKGGKDLEQLGLVEKGLAHDPTNPVLLNRLLLVLAAGGNDADKARQALQGMLARGEAAGVAHFALGVDAWHAGKSEEARLHWERATELAPQLTMAANNLAMLLSEGRRPDLAGAAQLINLVLDKVPNHPAYRDTRGRIYAKMGKWREALPDLEAALSKSPNDPSLHRVLATVYEQLGVPAMAAEHRRLAEQLAAKQKG